MRPLSRRARRLRIVLAIVLVGAALLAAGPRPRVTPPTTEPAPLPEDLDAYLADAEAQVPSLRPELARGILWADPARRARTRLALVFLHGFSASRREMSPLLEEAAAELTANVYFARLRGHGQDAEALAHVQAGDWMADALEAMAIGRRIGERVVVVGSSTGGTLATWLASKAPDMHALVLLSPNFGLRDRRARMLLWPWGHLLARAVIGPYRSFPPASDLQAQRWTTRYRVEGLLPMMALLDHVSGIDLARLRVPTLILYSEADEVVNPACILQRFRALGSARKVLRAVPGAGHVLAGDAVSPQTTPLVRRHIVEFLRGLDAQGTAQNQTSRERSK